MGLKAEDVAEYLISHPEFFEGHTTLLEDVYIPHPHGGRAISISERQQLALREKSKLLEDRMRELLQFGEENDAIGQKVHDFSLALLNARGVDALLATIYAHLKGSFAVPHTALRLWAKPLPGERAEIAEVGEELMACAEGMTEPYCGPEIQPGVGDWFGESAPALKSCALVVLRDGRAFGMLALASEDENRFYLDMGKVYLTRIGELVSATLARESVTDQGHVG
ncbi:MAG: DUF484 family protein [Burkholderiales bacterium]